jgi:hypothetical protein
MHLYAFGSICRGEIDLDSDVDLLALVNGHDDRLDPAKYSIYSYTKMKILWDKGSPFAWHLAGESRLLFASDQVDFLKSLDQPSPYTMYVADCEKFLGVFLAARASIVENGASRVFDLSTIFLSVRNIATCFSLGVLEVPNFSRHSALQLFGEFRIPISMECYRVLERSRILCTRSVGEDISDEDSYLVLAEFDVIEQWMQKLVVRANEHDRIEQPS